ncbi:MAG TPA: hypothetical protein VF950_25610 [Planctomycetota bacterium]
MRFVLILALLAVPQDAPKISLEAEGGKTVKVGKLEWVKVTAPAGYSGTGALQATPNENVLNEEDFVEKSPRIDFEVEFPKAGTYFVWVRGLGADQEDNSCHVGLDGKAVASADKIAEFDTEWTWTKDTKDGEDATLKIDAPGKRTLNVWMREDGFILDRIILTTDKTFTPSGKGP